MTSKVTYSDILLVSASTLQPAAVNSTNNAPILNDDQKLKSVEQTDCIEENFVDAMCNAGLLLKDYKPDPDKQIIPAKPLTAIHIVEFIKHLEKGITISHKNGAFEFKIAMQEVFFHFKDLVHEMLGGRINGILAQDPEYVVNLFKAQGIQDPTVLSLIKKLLPDPKGHILDDDYRSTAQTNDLLELREEQIRLFATKFSINDPQCHVSDETLAKVFLALAPKKDAPLKSIDVPIKLSPKEASFFAQKLACSSDNKMGALQLVDKWIKALKQNPNLFSEKKGQIDEKEIAKLAEKIQKDTSIFPYITLLIRSYLMRDGGFLDLPGSFNNQYVLSSFGAPKDAIVDLVITNNNLGKLFRFRSDNVRLPINALLNARAGQRPIPEIEFVCKDQPLIYPMIHKLAKIVDVEDLAMADDPKIWPLLMSYWSRFYWSTQPNIEEKLRIAYLTKIDFNAKEALAKTKNQDKANFSKIKAQEIAKDIISALKEHHENDEHKQLDAITLSFNCLYRLNQKLDTPHLHLNLDSKELDLVWREMNSYFKSHLNVSEENKRKTEYSQAHLLHALAYAKMQPKITFKLLNNLVGALAHLHQHLLHENNPLLKVIYKENNGLQREIRLIVQNQTLIIQNHPEEYFSELLKEFLETKVLQTPEALKVLWNVVDILLPAKPFTVASASALKRYQNRLNLNFLKLEEIALQYLAQSEPFLKQLGYRLLLGCCSMQSSQGSVNQVLEYFAGVLGEERDKQSQKDLLAGVMHAYHCFNVSKGIPEDRLYNDISTLLEQEKSVSKEEIYLTWIQSLASMQQHPFNFLAYRLFCQSPFSEKKDQFFRKKLISAFLPNDTDYAIKILQTSSKDLKRSIQSDLQIATDICKSLKLSNDPLLCHRDASSLANIFIELLQEKQRRSLKLETDLISSCLLAILWLNDHLRQDAALELLSKSALAHIFITHPADLARVWLGHCQSFLDKHDTTKALEIFQQGASLRLWNKQTTNQEFYNFLLTLLDCLLQQNETSSLADEPIQILSRAKDEETRKKFNQLILQRFNSQKEKNEVFEEKFFQYLPQDILQNFKVKNLNENIEKLEISYPPQVIGCIKSLEEILNSDFAQSEDKKNLSSSLLQKLLGEKNSSWSINQAKLLLTNKRVQDSFNKEYTAYADFIISCIELIYPSDIKKRTSTQSPLLVLDLLNIAFDALIRPSLLSEDQNQKIAIYSSLFLKILSDENIPSKNLTPFLSKISQNHAHLFKELSRTRWEYVLLLLQALNDLHIQAVFSEETTQICFINLTKALANPKEIVNVHEISSKVFKNKRISSTCLPLYQLNFQNNLYIKLRAINPDLSNEWKKKILAKYKELEKEKDWINIFASIFSEWVEYYCQHIQLDEAIATLQILSKNSSIKFEFIEKKWITVFMSYRAQEAPLFIRKVAEHQAILLKSPSLRTYIGAHLKDFFTSPHVKEIEEIYKLQQVHPFPALWLPLFNAIAQLPPHRLSDKLKEIIFQIPLTETAENFDKCWLNLLGQERFLSLDFLKGLLDDQTSLKKCLPETLIKIKILIAINSFSFLEKQELPEVNFIKKLLAYRDEIQTEVLKHSWNKEDKQLINSLDFYLLNAISKSKDPEIFLVANSRFTIFLKNVIHKDFAHNSKRVISRNLARNIHQFPKRYEKEFYNTILKTLSPCFTEEPLFFAGEFIKHRAFVFKDKAVELLLSTIESSQSHQSEFSVILKCLISDSYFEKSFEILSHKNIELVLTHQEFKECWTEYLIKKLTYATEEIDLLYIQQALKSFLRNLSKIDTEKESECVNAYLDCALVIVNTHGQLEIFEKMARALFNLIHAAHSNTFDLQSVSFREDDAEGVKERIFSEIFIQSFDELFTKLISLDKTGLLKLQQETIDLEKRLDQRGFLIENLPRKAQKMDEMRSVSRKKIHEYRLLLIKKMLDEFMPMHDDATARKFFDVQLGYGLLFLVMETPYFNGENEVNDVMDLLEKFANLSYFQKTDFFQDHLAIVGNLLVLSQNYVLQNPSSRCKNVFCRTWISVKKEFSEVLPLIDQISLLDTLIHNFCKSPHFGLVNPRMVFQCISIVKNTQKNVIESYAYQHFLNFYRSIIEGFKKCGDPYFKSGKIELIDAFFEIIKEANELLQMPQKIKEEEELAFQIIKEDKIMQVHTLKNLQLTEVTDVITLRKELGLNIITYLFDAVAFLYNEVKCAQDHVQSDPMEPLFQFLKNIFLYCQSKNSFCRKTLF